jgi:hypothetical protein
MVRSIITLFALAAVTSSALGDLDFTPKESFYMVETTRVPNVTFRNGTDAVTYSPPHGWSLSGGGRKLTLCPPDKAQACAAMETQPCAKLLPATEDNLKAYSDFALGRLPREAIKVAVTGAAICPFKFSTKSMVEVTVTYVHFGQQFTVNLLFLPHDRELITFEVTGRNADYTTLAKVFRASLYSLQGL